MSSVTYLDTTDNRLMAEPPKIQSVDQIEKEWKKKQRANKEPGKIRMHDQADELFKSIRDALEYAVEKKGLSNFIPDIRKFLADEKRAYGIDDCIRWSVLHSAVRKCVLDSKDIGFSAVQTEAAKEIIEEESNICIIIIRIVIEISPYLAFINLNIPHDFPEHFTKQEQELLTKKCHFTDLHGNSDKGDVKSTPLHKAAENGNGKAIKHMIHNGRCFQPGTLRQILRLKDTDPKAEETALSLAAIDEAGKLGALHALLSFDTGLADAPDTTFKEALKKGRGNVVEVFLEQSELRKKFAITDYILLAIKPLDNTDKDGYETTMSQKRREKQVGVINALIKAADQQSKVDEKVVEKIIQLDLEEVWSKNEAILKSNTSGLLHLAVQHQKIGFVKKFLEYDESVTARSNENYPPLWYNNNVTKDSKPTRRLFEDEKSRDIQKEIRDLIVAATIKSKKVTKMQDLLEIFQLSDETVNELCFDLSRFDSKTYSVSDFVHSLIHHQDYANLLSYEETLKYAAFPALDLKADDKEILGGSVQFDHTEIFNALGWLADHKKVKHITELTVLDRLVNPHDEVLIGEYVKMFKVEVLNWRLLDLAISVFRDSELHENNALPQIRELHLYTSGKRAVISHWLSENGIRSLTNLTTLEIYIVQELVIKEKQEATKAFIESEFDKLRNEVNIERETMRRENVNNALNTQETRGADDSWKLSVSVSIRSWNPTEERDANLVEIAERAVPKLSSFIKGYQTYARDILKEDSIPLRPIRVAVIDNGILSISPLVEAPSIVSSATYSQEKSSALNSSKTSNINNVHSDETRIGKDGKSHVGKDGENKTLWSRIKKGRSFVDDESRVSSWLFASDPHGTQMANLICAIDPCCDLYVAKVAEGRSGIIPARVERAVRWAISQDVDIISMSFAILEGTKGLEQACGDAIRNGIIILCSTPDEGLNNEKSCISGYSEKIITITACNEYGMVSQNASPDYKYAIQGIDVAAGKVPFLESKDCISGSSVSTAIAAGLSSLILACDRLAKERQTYEQVDRVQIVDHHFKQMVAEKTKYIILEKFAKIDNKIKDGLYINAQDIIERFFAEEKYPAS